MAGVKKIRNFDAGTSHESKVVDLVLGASLRDIPITPIDRALGALGTSGLPGLVAFASDGTIPAALTAIDPKLKLLELDAACDKLEDLAILLLSQVRASRHEVVEAIGDASAGALAAKVFGEDAIATLDTLERMDVLTPEEVENNRRLLRSTLGVKSKLSRRS